MTSLNQGWIGFNGEPLTGKAPPQLVVYAEPGVELSPEQSGAIAHAFHLFQMAVQVSADPDGFHVAHRVYPEGMRLQLNAMQGHYAMKAWIFGGSSSAAVYRGFVIKPQTGSDGTQIDWAEVSTLIGWFQDTWQQLVHGYKPDVTPHALPYYVDDSKWTVNRQIDLWEDYPYADVYTISDDKLFFNGLRHGGFPAAGWAMPVPIRADGSPATSALFAVSDGGVGRLVTGITGDTSIVPQWVKATSLTTAVPGVQWEPGVLFTQATGVASYCLQVGTSAGAYQIYRADITLLSDVPWQSVNSPGVVQIDVPGELSDAAGYSTTYTALPSAPWVAFDSEAQVALWSAGGKVYGASIVAVNPITYATYNRTFSASATVPLIGAIITSVSRGVTVAATLEQGLMQFLNVWGGVNIKGDNSLFNDPGYPPQAGGAPNSYASFWGGSFTPGGSGNIYPGSTTNIVGTQDGGKLSLSDTSYSEVTLSGGKTIFRTDVSHTINHIEVDVFDKLATGPAFVVGTGTWHYFKHDPIPGQPYPDNYTIYDYDSGIPWVGYCSPVQVDRSRLGQVVLQNVLTVNGSAKDFLYFDAENDVYVWMDSTLSGSGTNGVGSMTLSVKLMMTAGSVTASSDTFSVTVSVAPTANLIPPPGINFGTSNLTWRYVSPLQAYPVFVPRWFNQGLCPYLAYTTNLEQAHAVAMDPPFKLKFRSPPAPETPLDPKPRLVASFRVRAQLISRPDGYPLPDVPGALAMKLPMMEQLLTHHFPGIWFSSFKSIEAFRFSLNMTYPSTDVQTDVGIVASNPNSEFYRT